MRKVNPETLKQLLEQRSDICLSLYMPLQHRGHEQEKILKYKNLLKSAKQQIREMGHTEKKAREILAPAEKLQREPGLWKQRNRVLAAFVSKDLTVFLNLRNINTPEIALVETCFHLKPLLAYMEKSVGFYLLVLDLETARLLRCDDEGCGEIHLSKAPRGLKSIAGQYEAKPQMQMHTGKAEGNKKQSAVFHGQNDIQGEYEKSIEEYIRKIEKSVQHKLAGENKPLIAAGQKHILAKYMEKNKYSSLLGRVVECHPKDLSLQDLHARARGIAEAHTVMNQRKKDEGKYLQLRQTERTSRNLREILIASESGRIRSLFVAMGKHIWGKYNPKKKSVYVRSKRQAGDEDLLDIAAIQTYLKSGEVHVVKPEEIPGDMLMAAIFRY